MRSLALLLTVCSVLCALPGSPTLAADDLPFQRNVEVYRSEEGDVSVFTLRLEQPFLAEEFEKSNYLRLHSSDERAYLIYPKETKFRQKHAEFHGRLRGEGEVTLRLSYEIVSENPDGSRHLELRQGDVKVSIPAEATGPKSIFLEWARRQNVYFADLLRYYPEESFYQYCLLQSKARYGVDPPDIRRPKPDRETLETDIYQVFTGSLAIQEALQRQTLSGGGVRQGDLTTHVSTIQAPRLRSAGYEDLLEAKRVEEKIEPKIHEVTAIVPEDQYFLHFNSMKSAGELLDQSAQWGNSLLRLFTIRAVDNQVRSKFDDQLCLRREPLTQLFADGVISEVAMTGADSFFLEGTDATLIFRLVKPEVFEPIAAEWIEAVREKYPAMNSREFNYRAHKVSAHYTNDRVVSSFSVRHGEYLVYSNSHRAIRKLIDVATGISPSLSDAADYRYITTILPPGDAENAGYLFASEAFIRRLVGPEAKISERRRVQCFNHLVMLNNASLFYRLEMGRSPQTLSELSENRFIDPSKIVCPHGGGYALDVENDMCTCSLHNRLKYLTPNVELPVLNVSVREVEEYERYKQRYQQFWQTMFDPVAIRITVAPRLTLETCVLPFANGSQYSDLRGVLDKNPQPLGTAQIASSAVASVVMVPGRERIAEFVGAIPGVAEVLEANPTLTDLNWLGDRASVHLCDGESILEIDPTRLKQLELPMLGDVSAGQQAAAATVLAALNLPLYVSVDVESPDHAQRLLQQLSRQIFLEQQDDLMGLSTAFDAYRLPDYQEHAVYVISGQLYAIKIRLHVALVGNQLVAATKPEILRDVIDAALVKEAHPPREAHLLLRLNRRALDRMNDELQLYWGEKSRLACHRNIISIYTLYKLYDTPIDQIPHLSQAKYGVTYFCPDHGEYSFDADRNQVMCSVHGNREDSRQNPRLDADSSFSQFIESLDEIVASLRFQDDALIATVEIARHGRPVTRSDSDAVPASPER